MIVKTYSYYSDELAFQFCLDTEQGADTPIWEQEADYPPLSPRKAIQVAQEVLHHMLRDFPYANPEFHSVALVKVPGAEKDWWYYEVSWSVWPSDSASDRSSIELPVLMSGRCPQYKACHYDDYFETFFGKARNL